MKCLKCGEEIPENAIFCTNCGAKVEDMKEDIQEETEKEIVEEKTDTDVEEKEEDVQEVEENTVEEEDIFKEEETSKFKQTKGDETDKKPKKKKSKAGFIILVIIIIIAIAAGLIYYYREDLGLFEEEKSTSKSKEEKNETENIANVEEENKYEEEINDIDTPPEEVDKTLITTNKRDFYNGLAWSKVNNTWICINDKGDVVFRLPEEYTEVNDFENKDYTLVSNYSNKAVIDKEGKLITSDKDNQAFDKIISSDATAGCVVVQKNVDTYELNENQYGIIGFEGNWILKLSADNEFLRDYSTCGIENVLINRDQIYFVSTAKKIKTKNGRIDKVVAEDANYIYFYTNENKLIKVKNDGTKEVEVVKKDIRNIGNYENGLIYMYTSSKDKKKNKVNETRGYFDLSGKVQVKISEKNIISATEISENGTYGIITENNAHTRYITLINKDGKKVFDPIKGAAECKYIGEGKFFISYSNENGSESYVADEEGNRIFTASSMEKYNNGYAIKDEENYVDKTGMILTIMDK